MNARMVVLAALLIFCTMLLVGCGSAQPLPEAPTPIPTLAPATLPPPSGTLVQSGAPAPGLGASTFELNCAACHNLTTESKVGPGLAGLFDLQSLPNGQPLNDANLRQWILNGGGGMPGIPLAENELTAVISFLKGEEAAPQAAAPTTAPAQPAITAPPQSAASSDFQEGKNVFEGYCVVCHNITADPKVGPGLAGLFDLAALPNGQPVNDANLRAWIRNGGGAMPGMPVKDSELDVLLAYLKEATKP